jgi:hypothetical protein
VSAPAASPRNWSSGVPPLALAAAAASSGFVVPSSLSRVEVRRDGDVAVMRELSHHLDRNLVPGRGVVQEDHRAERSIAERSSEIGVDHVAVVSRIGDHLCDLAVIHQTSPLRAARDFDSIYQAVDHATLTSVKYSHPMPCSRFSGQSGLPTAASPNVTPI